jgi:hypothetical protein
MKLSGSRRTLSRARRRPSSRLPAVSSAAEAPAITSGSRQLSVSCVTWVATAACASSQRSWSRRREPSSTIAAAATTTMAIRTATAPS